MTSAHGCFYEIKEAFAGAALAAIVCQRITVFSFAVVSRFLSGRCFVLRWFTALELSMLHVCRFVFVIYSYVAIKAEATTLPLPKEDARAKRHLIVVL